MSTPFTVLSRRFARSSMGVGIPASARSAFAVTTALAVVVGIAQASRLVVGAAPALLQVTAGGVPEARPHTGGRHIPTQGWATRIRSPRPSFEIDDEDLPTTPVRASPADALDVDQEEADAGPSIVEGEGSEDGALFHDGTSETYRTVCVRLCDGYFFPVSFSTQAGHFARDAAVCKSSCQSAARLYVFANPGGTPEEMADLDGEPYRALKTAFLFRTRYDAACTCKPHPWDAASRDRHAALAAKGAPTRIVTLPEFDPRRRATRSARSISRDATPWRFAPDQISEPRRRPSGDAMLLGASPQRSVDRAAEPPSARRSQRYGRPGDWRSRAFSED